MVWKGYVMRYEIELTEYHANLLRHISEYSEIGVDKLIKGIIVNSIEQFDKDMQEYLEQSLPDGYYNYYDDYSGRYIE